MKYLLIILGLIISGGAEAQQWLLFSSDSIQFTAKYPANWLNKIKEGKRVFFTSPEESKEDRFLENVNIKATYNESYSSFKIFEAIPGVIAELKKGITELNLEEQREFKWNYADAVEIIYTGYAQADLTTKARIRQWFCINKNFLYVVTFTATAADSTHNATAIKIMNSIQFK